jgi:hypothetical protein
LLVVVAAEMESLEAPMAAAVAPVDIELTLD